MSGTLGGPLLRVAQDPRADTAALVAAARRSNGWFCIALADGADGVVVVTDAAGSRPAFCAHGPQGWAIGDKAKDVARATGHTGVDLASVADFMSNGSVCHPFTWYEGVRVLEPGSVTSAATCGVRAEPYWEPSEPPDVHDARGGEREWGALLRAEVEDAVRLGLDGVRTARVMFSGGEDSRVVASLVPPEVHTTLTTVLDWRNREYRLAGRAAWALGRRFEWVSRPPQSYLKRLDERVAVAGQGADVAYAHIFGPVAERFADVDVLLGGYLADAFFKSVYLCNVRRRRFLPEALQEPRPEVVMGVEDAISDARLAPALAAEVRRRRRAHQARIHALRPLTAGMWHDVWPLGPHCIDFVHHTVCRAVGPRVVEPFFAHRVYQLAARMPNGCRLERAAFRHAFAEGLGLGGWLSTSKGYRMRLGRVSGAATARSALICRSRWDRLRGTAGLQGPWTPDVVPLQPERYLDAAELERMDEWLGAILADGDAHRLLREPGLPNAVRWRALTLPFDGSALDGRVGCTAS